MSLSIYQYLLSSNKDVAISLMQVNDSYYLRNGSINCTCVTTSSLTGNISANEDATDAASATALMVHVAVTMLLVVVCVCTVAGNCLVVVAVARNRSLQTPTGYFIVSLAVSDLIVGLFVMPFGILQHVTARRWLLGLVMCDVWHVLDVLACTASIWNLAVIGVDRYLANRDPLGYRDHVSGRRIGAVIAVVWLLSALLALPAPVLWWRRNSPHLYVASTVCRFTDDPYYVVFSSLVSFYVPLAVLLSVYWRVFVIASRYANNVRSGQKEIKIKLPAIKCDVETSQHGELNLHGVNVPTIVEPAREETLILRMHRGAAKNHLAEPFRDKAKSTSSHKKVAANSEASMKSFRSCYGTEIIGTNSLKAVKKISTTGTNSLKAVKKTSTTGRQTVPVPRLTRRQAEDIPDEDFVDSECTASEHPSDTNSDKRTPTTYSRTAHSVCKALKLKPPSEPSEKDFVSATYPDTEHENTKQIIRRISSMTNDPVSTVSAQESKKKVGVKSVVSSSGIEPASADSRTSPFHQKRLAHQETASKLYRRSVSFIRAVKERRAARTLSVVVGCFVACWTPFFVLSILLLLLPPSPDDRLFGVDRTLVMTAVTWLGYANSTLNPLIYSRFSRDFRRAFEQLLCCGRRRKEKRPTVRGLNRMIRASVRLAAPDAVSTGGDTTVAERRRYLRFVVETSAANKSSGP